MINKIKPVIKEYIWAGTKLKSKYNKETSLDKVSESFEFSVLKNNESIINKNNNEVKINELLNSKMLIKLIDSSDNLSLQVHPSDEYALKNYNKLGKTECWYIVDNDEDAYIYLGFNKDYSKEEVVQAIENNTLVNLLNKYYVKPHDFFIVPSGTIHGIGPGVTLYEIQESSDLTFRLYDFDRVDKFGNKRELHIKESLDVLNYTNYNLNNSISNPLIDNEYFKLEKYIISGTTILESNEQFRLVTLIEGTISLNGENIKLGDSYLVDPNTELLINGSGVILVAYNK